MYHHDVAQNVNEYNVYNFTVECFVNTIAGDVPERTASKPQIFNVLVIGICPFLQVSLFTQ